MSEEANVPEENTAPRGEMKRYCAKPNFRFAGLPEFPFETDDPSIQERIEGSIAFRRAGRVWLDLRSQDDLAAEESALSGVNFHKLRKMAHALGMRDYQRLTKAELIEQISKEI